MVELYCVNVAHQRSPLVQGGLEIPIEVTVEMAVAELINT